MQSLFIAVALLLGTLSFVGDFEALSCRAVKSYIRSKPFKIRDSAPIKFI
jgi:hypothetical protein